MNYGGMLGGTAAALGGTMIFSSHAAAYPYNMLDGQPKLTLTSVISSFDSRQMVGSPIVISDDCGSSDNIKVDITDSENEDEKENVLDDAITDMA
jgi:hypothetical protein